MDVHSVCQPAAEAPSRPCPSTVLGVVKPITASAGGAFGAVQERVPPKYDRLYPSLKRLNGTTRRRCEPVDTWNGRAKLHEPHLVEEARLEATGLGGGGGHLGGVLATAQNDLCTCTNGRAILGVSATLLTHRVRAPC